MGVFRVVGVFNVMVHPDTKRVLDVSAMVPDVLVAVHDADIRVVQPFLEPVRLYQKLRTGVVLSSHIVRHLVRVPKFG